MLKYSIYLLAVVLVSCGTPDTVKLSEPSIKKEQSVEVSDTLTERKKYTFETELCSCTAWYDAGKYTEKELRDTYKMLWEYTSLPLNFDVDIEHVSGEKRVDFKDLGQQYKVRKKDLEQLKVIREPFWQDIHKGIKKELDEYYELYTTKGKAVTDPSVLLKSRFSKKCMSSAEALASGDSTKLVNEWERIVRIQMENNADPAYLETRFYRELRSSEWKQNAITTILIYGWGNCANASIKNYGQTEETNKRWDELFLSVDCECDEP